MANPNPNREGDFLFLIIIGEEITQVPNEYMMKIEISSFSENLDIESFLDWVYEVELFSDMT